MMSSIMEYCIAVKSKKFAAHYMGESHKHDGQQGNTDLGRQVKGWWSSLAEGWQGQWLGRGFGELWGANT